MSLNEENFLYIDSAERSDKQNCRTCDQVITELENIDDECDMFGIQMVKLKDPPLAKRFEGESRFSR